MTLSEHSLEQRIEQVASPLARALHVDLVEIMCSGKGAGTSIRIIIDKPEGVGIQDCEQLHHSLSRALDVLSPLPHSYRLEVSSPGLDRPLKHRKDYERALQKLIRLKLLSSYQGKSSIVGRLTEVSDDGLRLLCTHSRGKKEQVVDVTWNMIARGKLEVEF